MKKVDVSKLKLKKARVDDIEIAYKTFGKGYPIVLIMGFSGTMDMWDGRVLGALSARYKVIVFDSRGIGESTATSKKFSIELFADDAAGLLDELGIKKAHIMGWSMGTHVAQELVLRHPGKVNKLVLSSADPGGKDCVHPEEPLKTVEDTSGTLRNREERVAGVLFPDRWRKEHPDLREYFPSPKERTPVKNINRQARAMDEWAGSYRRLGRIKRPMLLITGTDDAISPAKNSFIIGEKVHGAWVTQIKGGGHGLMYQYPKDFSAAVLTFLESGEGQS